MIKIAICDDRTSDRALLKDLIEKTEVFQNAEYCEFESGDALTCDMECGRRYDIVFLDVDMQDLKGIETGKSIRYNDSDAMIIFVAEDPGFAIQAFDCNAFHYILKNDSYDKFLAVLIKARERYLSTHNRYVINCKEGPVCLPLSDIYYIEYYSKHLIFHTADCSYMLRGSIGTVAEDLADFGFTQVHQGYVVNLGHVHRFLKTDVVLDNGVCVMMSSRKRGEVLDRYTEYIQKYTV